MIMLLKLFAWFGRDVGKDDTIYCFTTYCITVWVFLCYAFRCHIGNPEEGAISGTLPCSECVDDKERSGRQTYSAQSCVDDREQGETQLDHAQSHIENKGYRERPH